MTIPPPTAPDPKAWEQGSIALQRDDTGLLHGQICVGETRYHIQAWRKGGDTHHILFECQPVSDLEFDAIQAQLSRKASG